MEKVAETTAPVSATPQSTRKDETVVDVQVTFDEGHHVDRRWLSQSSKWGVSFLLYKEHSRIYLPFIYVISGCTPIVLLWMLGKLNIRWQR